jgi:nucleoside 2-deoxyribosyltransferase
MRVYLAGAIHGMNTYQATAWRDEAKRLRPDIEFVDPMVRDDRGQEDANVDAIVDGDLADIASCDAVLASAENPSWGTAMEIRAASHEMGKRVIAFRWKPDVSPWLKKHATVVRSMTEALALL